MGFDIVDELCVCGTCDVAVFVGDTELVSNVMGGILFAMVKWSWVEPSTDVMQVRAGGRKQECKCVAGLCPSGRAPSGSKGSVKGQFWPPFTSRNGGLAYLIAKCGCEWQVRCLSLNAIECA